MPRQPREPESALVFCQCVDDETQRRSALDGERGVLKFNLAKPQRPNAVSLYDVAATVARLLLLLLLRRKPVTALER